MADFRIWGTITQVEQRKYFVAVSAVPATLPADAATTTMRIAEAFSRSHAEALQEQMMIQLGAEVRTRGDRVVDVED